MHTGQVHLSLVLYHVELSRDAGKLVQLHNTNKHLSGRAEDLSCVVYFGKLIVDGFLGLI